MRLLNANAGYDMIRLLNIPTKCTFLHRKRSGEGRDGEKVRARALYGNVVKYADILIVGLVMHEIRRHGS